MERRLQGLYGEKPHQIFEVGKTYWLYMVKFNGKRSGFARNVKPFEITLTKLDNSYYTNQGQSYWSWGSYNWDLSKNTKYKDSTNATADIFHYGVICDTYEEAKAGYNKEIERHSTAGEWNSSKYSEEYRQTKIKAVLKNKIK